MMLQRSYACFPLFQIGFGDTKNFVYYAVCQSKGSNQTGHDIRWTIAKCAPVQTSFLSSSSRCVSLRVSLVQDSCDWVICLDNNLQGGEITALSYLGLHLNVWALLGASRIPLLNAGLMINT